MSPSSRAAWIHAEPPHEAATARTRRVLARYFEHVEARASGSRMAALFTEDLLVDIPRPSLALAWSGPMHSREQLASFIDSYRAGVLPQRFELRQFIVEGEHAIVLGDLLIWGREARHYLRIEFASHYSLRGELIAELKIYERSHEPDAAERAALQLPDDPTALDPVTGGAY